MTDQEKLDELKTALGTIGWSIKGKYPNSWIFDHEGNHTNYWVTGGSIRVENADKNSSITFTFQGSKVTVLENDGVAFGTDKCFILFRNFTIK